MVKERAEGESFSDLLIANLPGAVFRFRADEALSIEYISSGCRRLTEFSETELTDSQKPQSWIGMIHPDDQERIKKMRRDYIQNGIEPAAGYVEYRINTKSKKLKTVCEHFGYVRSRSGEIVAVEGFIADISKQLDFKEQIRRTENQYHLLADYMHDMVCLHDLEGTFQYVSPSSKTLLGFAPDQMLGTSFTELFAPEDSAASVKYIEQCQDECAPNLITEARIKRKSGKYIWVETMWQTIRDKRGEVKNFLTVTRNIHKRKLLEQEREANRKRLKQLLREEKSLLRKAEKAQREAEQANRAKDEFLQMVSHEFRTPLTTIKTLVRVLQNDGEDPAERHEYLETIAAECDHQIDLILNLLDVSRLEEGIIDLRRAPTDIGTVLKACDRVERSAVELRRQTLTTHWSENLPPIISDEKALRRALCSIIENAIKYTPEGGKIELRARLSRKKGKRGARLVVVSVADNGRGIHPDDLPHIFDKFSRGRRIVPRDKQTDGTPDDAEGRAETPGVGLGLYLASRLIIALGGDITVESEVHRGTIFKIYLPVWDGKITSDEVEFNLAEDSE